MYLFNIPSGKNAEDAFRALTRQQVEEVLFGIPKIIEIYGARKLIPLFRARYRSFMFHILYVFWQDYYDMGNYRELFLTVFKHPKTALFSEEVGFSPETLIELTTRPRAEARLAEMARDEGRDMREFLEAHRISRESAIGVDAMSIFFLFCTAEDYLDFGVDRLILAAERFDIKNQAKMLNNMMRVLTKEERDGLSDVFRHFIGRYPAAASGTLHEFWSSVFVKNRETLQEEYGAHLVV